MKKLIWYIDHDVEMGNVIDAELPKLTMDYNVAVISNPIVIDEKLKERLPDIIFIDSAIAEHDNASIVHDLRTKKNLRKVPFVILGNDVRVEERAEKLEVESLKKPFDIKQFLKKAKEVLRKQKVKVIHNTSQ